MAISSIDAGKTLCELSGWEISNLRLQKVLYFAHMFHLGTENGEPLIDEGFEAWDYGPVAPRLYNRVKRYGSGFIRSSAFYWDRGAQPGTSEYRLLKQAYEATKNKSPGEMVRISHWQKGAWHHMYEPGTRRIPIPNDHIMDEYNARVEAAGK